MSLFLQCKYITINRQCLDTICSIGICCYICPDISSCTKRCKCPDFGNNQPTPKNLAQKVLETVKKYNSPYEKIGAETGSLVAEKQKAYGDMIRGAQDIFRILYPEGIKPEQYDDALLVLRVMDKIGRIARGDKKAFGESPWRDICGYAILGAEQDERTIHKE